MKACHLLFGLGLSVSSLLAAPLARADASVCEHIAAPLEAARFDKQLAALEEFVPSGDDDIEKAIEKIEAKDARNFIFKIEALTRLYRHVYGDEIKADKSALKHVEDLVGWYKDKCDFLTFAQQMKAPRRVLKAMEATRDKAHADLREYMPQFRGMLDGLKSDISETDWENQTRDRKHVIAEIAKELRKREPLDYDMNNLAEGIHELRRNLRWILIYIQALDGMILADKGTGKIHEYSYLETHPIAQSKYSKLDPNPAVRKPVHIPLTYFLALSKLVEELGVIKSTGEHVESLAQGFLDAGMAKNRKQAIAKAERLASKDPAYVPDTAAAATQIRDELKRTKLLKKLRKALERG